MSKASELIAKAEREASSRWDDPNNPNALAMIFGAVARELGTNPHNERDDLAAGIVLMDEIAHGEDRKQRDALLVFLLQARLSPDDIAGLRGEIKDCED